MPNPLPHRVKSQKRNWALVFFSPYCFSRSRKYGDTILNSGRSELADCIHSMLTMDHNSASLTEMA